jgi:hypothetical protein
MRVGILIDGGDPSAAVVPDGADVIRVPTSDAVAELETVNPRLATARQVFR